MKSDVGTGEKSSFEPDLKEARKYLRWLANAQDAKFDYRLSWPKEKARPEGRPAATKLRGNLSDAILARKLVKANQVGYGVYVTVNETDGEGVKAENIVGYRMSGPIGTRVGPTLYLSNLRS
jgi:hypothetical protein